MGLPSSFPGFKAAYAEIAGGSINTPRAKPFPTVLILILMCWLRVSVFGSVSVFLLFVYRIRSVFAGR